MAVLRPRTAAVAAVPGDAFPEIARGPVRLAQPGPVPRAVPVDLLRGAVVALMVFVNYLGEMPGAPAWTQHLPASADGYTLTDMVFPWFLFLVGVAIPLSLVRDGIVLPVRRALARVLPRVATLVLLGIVLLNKEATDGVATGMRPALWLSLTLTAALVLCRVTPAVVSPRRRRLELAVKALAAMALVMLLLVWRGHREDGSLGPLASSWWGILGIIGWAYLLGAVAFLLTRGRATALLGVLGLLVSVSIGTRLGQLGPLRPLAGLFEVPAIFGSLPAVVVAGTVVGGWLAARSAGRTLHMLGLGAGLWVAGWFLHPLNGYHKMGATESWALSAAGQATLLLAVLDRAIGDRDPLPLRWLGLAGANALLAYLIPEWLDAVSHLADVDLMPLFERGGAAGMLNAAALTALVLAMAALCRRGGVIVKV
jgi:heparan-alpha-glucosaminide N-acetyltransferase